MAIRDQSYKRYDGPIEERLIWAVIGWNGFRTYLKFWRMRLALLAVWMIPLLFALLILGEAAFSDSAQLMQQTGGPSHLGLSLFISLQVFALGLVYAARGCGIISDDLRHRTFQLYFSKPITRLDYAAGKVTTLLLVGVLAVILPAAMLVGLRTLFFVQTDYLGAILVLHLQGMLLLVVLVAMLASVLVGLSSLTRSGGYAVLAWIGVLVVPLIIQTILAVTTGGSPWIRLLSLNGIIALAADAWMGGADAMPAEISRWVPFAAIASLIAAGLGMLRWRLERLDRTS